MPDLQTLVSDFARGVEQADGRHPQAVNVRTNGPYQPGIGPHTEAATLELVMNELVAAHPDRYGDHRLGVPYSDGSRQRCDLCLGGPPPWKWAVEVKMIRMLGDNGKPNDNLPTHILSPYPAHRSALTDCAKLHNSGLGARKAILIYGYECSEYPVDLLVGAFVALASQQVLLGPETRAAFQGLIHPVHLDGVIVAWELLGSATSRVREAESPRRPRISVAGSGRPLQPDRYTKLTASLERKSQDRLRCSFQQIEEILDFQLPYSARHYLWYWGTDRSPLARAIMDGGWLAIHVDLGEEAVVLQRDAVDPPRFCGVCMTEAAKGSLYCVKHQRTR